jgi:hypothetical protein
VRCWIGGVFEPLQAAPVVKMVHLLVLFIVVEEVGKEAVLVCMTIHKW